MVLIKAYTSINLGDDLFIKLICEKHPNTKFCIIAKREYTTIFKDIKNLKILWYTRDYINSKYKDNRVVANEKMAKFVNKLSKKCDTYVYIGGSVFIEPKNGNIYRIKLFGEELSTFNKSYIIGSNFGPYYTDDYFKVAKDTIIPNLNHITFRDLDSYSLFSDLPNTSLAPDVIFSMDTSKYINEKKKEIGISLIHHLDRDVLAENYNKYLAEIAELIKKHIPLGYTICLLSFCKPERDLAAINDLLNILPESYLPKIRVEEYVGDIEHFMNLFSQFEKVVGTRFHSIILGIKFNCEVIPICYSNKTVNMLHDLNFTDYCTFENLDIQNKKFSLILDKEQLEKITKNSEKHFLEFKKSTL